MQISVKNIGSLYEAKNIQIKNMNVFIGKNGTGKTYFAKLIYFLNLPNVKFQVFKDLFSEKIRTAYDEKEESIIFTPDDYETFNKTFHKSVINNYAFLLGGNNTLFKNFSFDIKHENTRQECKLLVDENDEIMRVIDVFFKVIQEKPAYALNSYYLPAARANFMLTYRHLFTAEMESLRSNKDQKMFPLAEYEFLKSIWHLNTKNRSSFSKYATAIEKNIFVNGKLSIQNPKTQELPTFEYKIGKEITLDLIMASSSVTELSPLVVYFKHMARSGNLLIIDEPELSLHPDAQAELMKILVKSVNDGLKIILITHSPYILEVLNNHLQRDKISDYPMDKSIESFPALSFDETSVYLFEDHTITNILDAEVKLVDDKLLSSFNSINSIYEKMRDIEWEALGK